ncbi:MAG TPA: aminotransferase class V-fold PLP-dependent enzyme, partial [Gemmatimonadaceae bacterium]|nr:aminotransferase class V-fold PLP-dependent enzyme [Gemmatimonadaceae bacterium]
MQTRRHFVKSLAGAGLALPMMRTNAFAQLFQANVIAGARTPEQIADDESYWSVIQAAFDVDRTMINLNNGGISPAPTHVLAELWREIQFTNSLPVENMWGVLQPRMEGTRRELAEDFGCDPEEMAVVRNASEAMENLIFGFDLQKGDEVIVTNQNYGRMITSWQQRVAREGIVLKQISFKVPPPSQEYLVEQFRAAITPRTKVIEVTHITNLTGQIMPVRQIVEMARPLGIQVTVDGAHAFNHFPFTRDQLGCDYYGTSLHKWTLAPIGSGFLYVRKDRIPQLWSLMASAESQKADIRKFEEIGTHPQANFNSVSVALAFSRGIGTARKVARLRYLRNRWANALLAESPRVHVLTPLTGETSGGICLFTVDGLDPVKLGQWLHEKYKIVNTPIVHPEFSGIRITPNVYTTTQEVDTFTG